MTPRRIQLRVCRGCGTAGGAAMQTAGRRWVLLDLPTPTGICCACADAVQWEAYALATVGTEPLLEAEARAILGGRA